MPVDAIRLATLADAPAVAELTRYSSVTPRAAREAESDAGGAAGGLRAAQDVIRHGTCYVAESDGRIIGVCAWARRRARGSGSITDLLALAVHPAHPPAALTRLLLTLCTSAAAREGSESVEAVVPWTGRGAYLECGFRAAGPLEVPSSVPVTASNLRLRKPVLKPRPLGSRRTTPPASRLHRSFAGQF
jgi:predicted N-acetyltransferase YhbS